MKTQNFICTIVFYLIIASSFAQDSEKVMVQPSLAPGVFILGYKGQGGNVKVTIYNAKDEVIFSETVKLASFTRPYNFTDQAPGDFKFVVEDKDGKTEKKFSYSRKKVENNITVSKIANSKNKYLLAVENKESDAIRVRILAEDKSVIHEEEVTVNGKFAMVFKIKDSVAKPVFEVSGSDGAWKTFSF